MSGKKSREKKSAAKRPGSVSTAGASSETAAPPAPRRTTTAGHPAPPAPAAPAILDAAAPPMPGAAPGAPAGAERDPAPLVETREARYPWRAPRGYIVRHLDLVLDEHQAYIFAGLVDGLVPQASGDPVHLLDDGRAVASGPSARTLALRWLLEELGRQLGAAPQTTHPARARATGRP